MFLSSMNRLTLAGFCRAEPGTRLAGMNAAAAVAVAPPGDPVS